MALLDRPVVGLECKLYYNAATHASPTWTQITRAINVSFSITIGEADASSRMSTWRGNVATLKDLEISFTYRKKSGTDTVFTALIAAALAGTVLEYCVMDAATTETGAQGIRAFCQIFSVGNTQDLESTEEVEFTLKPTYKEESAALVNPDWYTVGS
jgi:hypothetical protein